MGHDGKIANTVYAGKLSKTSFVLYYNSCRSEYLWRHKYKAALMPMQLT